MTITRSALKRIKQLKDRQGVSANTGLRLELDKSVVYLRWDPSGPKNEDLVVVKQGLPIFIGAQAYLHLTDYALDCEGQNGAGRFLLRPRAATLNGKPRGASQGENQIVRRIKS